MIKGNSDRDAKGRRRSAAAFVAILSLLTGCAVGPNFVTPLPPDVAGYTPEPLGRTTASANAPTGGAQRFGQARDLPGEWWTLFHSRALNTLVEKALAANPDLQAAQAALRVAKENVYAQQGALFPAVDASFGGIRQKPAIGVPSDVGSDAPTFNLFTGQLNISYTPDVFGATRRSIEALPPLRKQLALQRDLLAALSGGFPSQQLPEQFVLGSLRLPRDLPVSLPSQLVEQRPDVRAAEANLHAASAQIGVAIANRLPNITLTATTGSTALSVDQLFTPGTGFWSAAGVVTQPIFHGGTLLHRELAAKAAYDQAAAQYRSAVIVAFQNVADSLRAIQSDAVALQKAAASERAAFKSLDIVRHRLALGDINYLALLNAQQTYQQALLSLAAARAARFADTVALFQALGGGWWNRSDVEPERPLTITDVLQ